MWANSETILPVRWQVAGPDAGVGLEIEGQAGAALLEHGVAVGALAVRLARVQQREITIGPNCKKKL